MKRRSFTIWLVLVGHFLRSFFRLQFLDDAGQESFKRALLGLLTSAIGVGLFLSRLYMWKYKHLSASRDLELIIFADRLFMVAAPMLMTTAAIALIAPSIFPGELDFRILMALPLSRGRIFTAKFAALFMFVAVAILVPNLFIALPLSFIVSGRIAGESPVLATITCFIGGIWAAGFAATAIIALQGLVVGVAPRRWFHGASISLQSGTVAALVIALPFVGRLPGLWRTLGKRSDHLLLLPPAWFLGAVQGWLGHQGYYDPRLAPIAMVSTVVAMCISIAASLAAYRRFDQAMSPSTSPYAPAWWNRPLYALTRQHLSTEAVRDFISVTIRRSNIHLLVVAAVFAIGAALAANSVLDSMNLEGRWLARAILAAPFALMAGSVVGFRTALLIPTNPRAAWIFRMTEQEGTRSHQLNAVRRGMFMSAVALPTIWAMPLIAGEFGYAKAAGLVPITLFIGSAFVEAVCIDWRRIPFTCTFLFAKRPPVYTVFWIVLIFGWFVFLGTSLLFVASSGLVPWLIVATISLAVDLALRSYRRRTWGRWPLEFEDYLPDGLDALRLRE
jgi:hypothetical protein